MAGEGELVRNLHTAMLRYVLERMNSFAEFQRQPEGVYSTSSSMNELDTFMQIGSRMGFLNSVRWELAGIYPETMETLNSMREIIEVGATIARDHALDCAAGDPIGTKAVQEEFEALLAYMRDLSLNTLQSVEPLPYFHSLSKQEYYARFTAFGQRWGITVKEGWFPLDYYPAIPRPAIQVPVLEAFEGRALSDASGNDIVRRVLKAKGIERIFIFEVSYPGVECDVEFLNLVTGSLNIVSFTFSQSLDWMIHTSWQEAVTIGGDWLLEGVKREWPEWEKHIRKYSSQTMYRRK